MEYTTNRVERPPGMTNDCLLVEGTIQLAGYDADLNIVFPGGQKAVLQWRVDGPTLDLCFGEPVDVFNDGPDMKPAPASDVWPHHHSGVVQLVIPLRPEYGEEPECPYVTQDLSPKGYRPKCDAWHDAGGHHVQAPRDDEREEAN